MNKLSTISQQLPTAVMSLALGFLIATLLNTGNTNKHPSKHDQSNERLQSLEIKLSNIDVSLKQLIEQNNTDNLIVKLNSTEEENITSASLRKILKEIIHEELDLATQNDVVSNEDTSRAWELISQAQAQPTEITAAFFQTEEINALPKDQKEMVISEIIGMMNRGEIDADHFFGKK